MSKNNEDRKPKKAIFIIGVLFVLTGGILTCLATMTLLVEKKLDYHAIIYAIASLGSILTGSRLVASQLLPSEEQKNLDYVTVFTSIIVFCVIIGAVYFL